MRNPPFPLRWALLAIVSGASAIPSSRAADPNLPADFTISRNVLAPAPARYGTNLAINGFADFNNGTTDPGFEPFVIRKMAVATGGGGDYIVNAANVTTTNYDVLADGFFDGAVVRVYRIESGRVRLVRTGTVSHYIGGWNRISNNRVTGTTVKDGTLVAGRTYWVVRALDTSGNLSANSNMATAVPLVDNVPGDTISTTFTPVVTDSAPPAAPTGLTATANADGTVSLSWNANGESDLAGYYVSRAESLPAEHNRIYFTATDSSSELVQNGDFYLLDSNPANVPMDKLSPRVKSAFTSSDTWREVGGSTFPNRPVQKTRDTSTVCPENGGKSSLKLTAVGPDSYEVSARQFRWAAPDSFYGALVPGRTYRVEVWLKQEGVASGAVSFRMTNAYSTVSRTWSGVTGTWQKFTHDFVAPASPAAGTPTVEQYVAFTGPGTVWMDNLLIHDPAQTPFALRAEAKQALTDFAPGWLRTTTGHTNGAWGSTMEDWTNTDALAMNQFRINGRGRPEQPYHLPMVLQLAKDAGANPWLNVGSYMDEQEWANFIEYLAGPAGTPYGDKRIAQRGGITTPWTDEFARIRIEYGNEMWNPTFEWTLSGAQHGAFAEYFFNKARQSPYFASFASKVDFGMNGQLVSTGVGGYTAAAIQVPTPTGAPGNAANYGNIALYLGGWDASVDISGGTVNDTGYQNYLLFPWSFGKYWFDLQATTRDQVTALGRPYQLSNYESGPGYGLPSPGLQYDPVIEAYGKSLAAGVATLDSFLYGTSKRIDPQCYFTLQPGVNWSSHGYVNNGYFPHPSWLALQMRNRYVTGDMMAVATNIAPTQDVPPWINTRTNTPITPTATNSPLVTTYAFREGAKYSVFVLSRKLNASTPVTLRLPFTGLGSATLYKLTGDPRARNDQGVFNIQETQEPVANFTPNYSFTMPPGSAYLFVFNDTTAPVETNPTVTIAQSLGQADPTTAQSISFAVHFSQPVTGFTASDVLLSGTAGASVAAVVEVDPFFGTDFRVDVSGMTGSGTVTIGVPANAATNSSAQGSLAATIIDNTVQFTMPPFVAYDDFNLAPSSAPNAPFLHGVATGAGFSAAWQISGFTNAAGYGDGYKLANNTPLTFANLRRSGSYGAGGKDFSVTARALDVAGTFGFYRISGSSPAVIGRTGTTLWLSALFRKDTGDTNRVLLTTLNNSSNIAVGGSNLGIGYAGEGTAALVGGTRYWSLQVRNAANNGFDVVRSNVPIVTGQTALLAVKITFGAQDRFDLFVNPPSLGGTAPASPDATWTTTGATDINFHTLLYSGGTTGANQSSIDEIRWGQSFADVTPIFAPVEMWRLSRFGSAAATGNAAPAADPDGDGLSNALEYSLGTEPLIASSGAFFAPTFTNISGENYLTLEVPKNSTATDTTFTIEVSPDLVQWFSGPAYTTIMANTPALLRVRDNVPRTGAARRFIRLNVATP